VSHNPSTATAEIKNGLEVIHTETIPLQGITDALLAHSSTVKEPGNLLRNGDKINQASRWDGQSIVRSSQAVSSVPARNPQVPTRAPQFPCCIIQADGS
jgi:hypothetical protein